MLFCQGWVSIFEKKLYAKIDGWTRKFRYQLSTFVVYFISLKKKKDDKKNSNITNQHSSFLSFCFFSFLKLNQEIQISTFIVSLKKKNVSAQSLESPPNLRFFFFISTMRDTIFQSCVEPQQNVSFIGIMTILIINHITHHRNSAQSQTKQEVNSSLKENTLMSSDIFDYGLHELQVDNSCNYVQIKLRCASILKHFIPTSCTSSLTTCCQLQLRVEHYP